MSSPSEIALAARPNTCGEHSLQKAKPAGGGRDLNSGHQRQNSKMSKPRSPIENTEYARTINSVGRRGRVGLRAVCFSAHLVMNGSALELPGTG
jgi:hypothetical protein